MRHRFTLALLLLACTAMLTVATATADPTAPADGDGEWEGGWKAEMRDIEIPMRDGEALAANVLLPEKAGAYPVILVQTPYNKDNMGREFGGNNEQDDVGRGSNKAWSMFDRDNYGYVFVDWRGFYGSKAAMDGVDKRKWKRGQDGYDSVEWIGGQPWCNGKVGTWGGSALGKQQFDTASEQPPHLVCAAPLIAYQGQRYSAYYEGGVRLEAHTKTLDFLGFGVSDVITQSRLPSDRIWSWAQRMTYTPQKIEVPCLLISGWWDNYPRDIIENYKDLVEKGGSEATRTHTRLIMGPWSHTAIDVAEQGDLEFEDAELYSTKITLLYFDYFLREMHDNGWADTPRVHAFQCGEGWATGETWEELVGGDETTLQLRADGAISAQKPAEASDDDPRTRVIKYNPRLASPTIGGQNLPPLTHGPKELSRLNRRDDIVAYDLPVGDDGLSLRGEVELKLWVSCNRVDCDVHVRLCDTFPDGKRYLLAETIQRAKLRDYARVQLLEPGTPVELTLHLPPHAYTFAKDHMLTLLITGGNTPRYERNPHTGEDAWDGRSALSADITLHHDADHPSRVTLPLLKADAESTGE